MKNQTGFSAVEGLLILLIVIILGGTGWYVLKSNNNAGKSLDNATTSNSQIAIKTTTDTTNGWASYSSTDGQFTLKYPKTWVKASSSTACSTEILLLGGSSSSVGVCGGDGAGALGQMSVISLTGVQNAQIQYKEGQGFKNVTTRDLTVNGVKGTRIQGEASGQSGNPEGGLPDGTLAVQYIFVTNNRTYVASYVKQKTYPDVLKDFDLMITKTMQFHS